MEYQEMKMYSRSFLQPENEDEVFLRLYDYVDEFDKDWKRSIRPASSESIESLKRVSELQRWRADFPPLYKLYLERMGEDDGGLLSTMLIGTASISEIIDLYEDFHIYSPEVFDTPYLAFFQQEMGGEFSFDLRDSQNENILRTDCGEVCGVVSESFKKLLFQSAFSRFERFHDYMRFSGSPYEVKSAVSVAGEKDVFSILDEISKDYGFSKVWFSDQQHYIAIGEISLCVRNTHGAFGFVTSDNTFAINEFMKELMQKTGVSVISYSTF